MTLRYCVFRKENFDVRERGTYNVYRYAQYGITPTILAEKEKVGTDPRNMQCLEADNLYFGDKSDVFNYDIIEFVDGEIHTIDLPWDLIKKGKKVVCRIWTKPEFKKVYDIYADSISYLFSWGIGTGIQTQSHAVIPPAVETDFFGFRQPRIKPEPLKIGYLGILVYWKGHQFIERIVADLADAGADIELNMFGRKDEDPLQHPAIKYHGLITDRNDVPKAFQSFDVYACPWPDKPIADPDAFWVVCMEALSCGLPIITFKCGSSREFIDEGKNGYAAIDVNNMKQKLSNYYKNPEILRQHSYHSRIKAMHKFHPEVVTAQMAKWLYSL